jgi:hypothetical protein
VIFPGGSQAYRKPLALQPGARLLSIWAACDYSTPVGRFNQRFMKLVLNPPKNLDFSSGLRNHRVRRTFSLVPPLTDTRDKRPSRNMRAVDRSGQS